MKKLNKNEMVLLDQELREQVIENDMVIYIFIDLSERTPKEAKKILADYDEVRDYGNKFYAVPDMKYGKYVLESELNDYLEVEYLNCDM